MKWVGSPNFTKGRENQPINRIVLHWIVGKLESADVTFQNTTRNTSAHYGIGDDEVHQYVKEEDTAHHAGVWAMNLRSIGIEHEGGPDLPITDETYRTSANLVRSICQAHAIPVDREHIIKHNEVRATQCPGTLDIDKIIAMAKVGTDNIIDEDQSRALAVVKTFKDHDPELKNGNYEGAANTLVGAYSDLGAAKTAIDTLSSFREGVASQLNIGGEKDTSKIATALSAHIKESDENAKGANAGLQLFSIIQSWVNGKTWIWPEQTNDLIESFLSKTAIPLPETPIDPKGYNGLQLILLGISRLLKGR